MDEFGSEASSEGLSRQTEAHGEFGVTCSARTLWEKRRIVRRDFMRPIAILKVGPEQTQV